NRTAEFIGDQVANCARPETGFIGSNDRRTAELLPFEHQTERVTVELPLPPDRYPPVFRRQRSILCRVSGKLVQHHCHCLAGLWTQDDLGPVDLGVVQCGIWCELLTNELCQRYAAPSTKTQ